MLHYELGETNVSYLLEVDIHMYALQLSRQKFVCVTLVTFSRWMSSYLIHFKRNSNIIIENMLIFIDNSIIYAIHRYLCFKQIPLSVENLIIGWIIYGFKMKFYANLVMHILYKYLRDQHFCFCHQTKYILTKR